MSLSSLPTGKDYPHMRKPRRKDPYGEVSLRGRIDPDMEASEYDAAAAQAVLDKVEATTKLWGPDPLHPDVKTSRHVSEDTSRARAGTGASPTPTTPTAAGGAVAAVSR